MYGVQVFQPQLSLSALGGTRHVESFQPQNSDNHSPVMRKDEAVYDIFRDTKDSSRELCLADLTAYRQPLLLAVTNSLSPEYGSIHPAQGNEGEERRVRCFKCTNFRQRHDHLSTHYVSSRCTSIATHNGENSMEIKQCNDLLAAAIRACENKLHLNTRDSSEMR